jgi:hypothetical protein
VTVLKLDYVVRSGLVVLAVMAGSGLADAGTLRGSVSFTGEQILDGGYVSALAGDDKSAAGAVTGSTYSVAVPGGTSYRPFVEARIANSTGMDTTFAVSKAALVAVGATDDIVDNVTYNVARVSGQISVNGGTVESYQLLATATAANGDRFTARVYGTGRPNYSFPMAVGVTAQIYGTATILRGDGVHFTVPVGNGGRTDTSTSYVYGYYPITNSYWVNDGCNAWGCWGHYAYYTSYVPEYQNSATSNTNVSPSLVSVLATGAAWNYSINASALRADPGTIKGEVGLNSFGADLVSNHKLRTISYSQNYQYWTGHGYDRYASTSSGQSTLGGNGPYALTTFGTDTTVTLDTTFRAPYGSYHTSASVSAPNGSTTTKDFRSDLGYAAGQVNVRGFVESGSFSGSISSSMPPYCLRNSL